MKWDMTHVLGVLADGCYTVTSHVCSLPPFLLTQDHSSTESDDHGIVSTEDSLIASQRCFGDWRVRVYLLGHADSAAYYCERAEKIGTAFILLL